jgi:alkylation response protein AidB-like acyl-CoA dehydrogenase
MTATTDMNLLTDDAFRSEVRQWVEANYPEQYRYLPRRITFQECQEWYLALSRKGWLCPLWPREHGGMALDPGKFLVFVEEFERHGVARMPDQGIVMVGPLLMKYGTDAQRALHLPKIVAGEHIWCQGYSEPNSGSDLASLRTEAVLDGDEYVVNGQKIWTSMAHCVNWIYMLVRTDKSAAKPQEGISFLLCPLDAPGITIRTIPNIKGEEEFCEVFLDDVRIPRENLVGEPHKGWTMAKALLGFERIFIGNPRLPEYALNRLRLLAETMGAFADPVFKERYTRLRLDVYDLSAAFERYVTIMKAGGDIGPDVSYLKVWATETYQRVTEAMVELAGDYGQLSEDVEIDGQTIDVMAQFLGSRPATIYGGSNEIQRNILAKRVLGL